MRIHANTLTLADIHAAAKLARVDYEVTSHGSRSRGHAFNVKLTGESRRRPNGGNYGADRDDYAATWDQWGVFLAELFARDASLTIPSAYADGEEYARRTADRFGAPEAVMTSNGYVERFVAYGWPADAHGDHTFRFQGIPGEQGCTKCSAIQRW